MRMRSGMQGKIEEKKLGVSFDREGGLAVLGEGRR